MIDLAWFAIDVRCSPVTTVCFVGAGSAEFTRQLLRDLLSYDDLGPLTLVLHDIDPRRLELAEGLARIAVAAHGRAATVRADGRSARGAGRRGLRHQLGQRRRTRGDGHRLRGPRAVRPAADDRGHARRRRSVPRAADLPVPRRPRHRHGGGLPGGLAAQLHEPDGDEHPVPRRPRIRTSRSWGCATRSSGPCTTCRALVGVPLDEVTFHSAGVNHQAWVLRWERDGQSLYPLLDERIAADPELRRRVRVDMYRRLGFYPTETSEHSSEYVAWYLHDDAEIERLRIPVGDYLRISADNAEEIERADPAGRRGSVRRARGGRRGVRAAGHPQHGHRHAAHDPGHRRQRGLDRQSGRGRRRRGALCRRRFRRSTRSPVGALAAAVRGAEPAVPVGRRPHRPGRRPRAVRSSSGRR